MGNNENITREEVKKEFELERMILFSDAVFAIVITLMAIDIKLPESEKLTERELIHGINLLMPVFLTYAVSFIFIGVTWHNHLKVFSLLKDYDTGLIVRNLLLLFFIGLFPFGASIAAKGTEETVLPFFIYMFIIALCFGAQYALHHYIILGKPQLRNDKDITEFKVELKAKQYVFISLLAIIVLVFITNRIISDPELKPLSILWVFILPVVGRMVRRKKARTK